MRPHYDECDLAILEAHIIRYPDVVRANAPDMVQKLIEDLRFFRDEADAALDRANMLEERVEELQGQVSDMQDRLSELEDDAWVNGS